MFETIQEIINSPHTDWTTVIIMLSIIGLVLLGIVAAVIHIIVAKIKGWELPNVKLEEDKIEFSNKREWEENPLHPLHPHHDEWTSPHR